MAPRRKARPVKSCTECKQVKLRCDARQRSPAPCTRCSDRGLSCVVDATFCRTPARRRLDELNREISQLRRTINGAAPHSRVVDPRTPLPEITWHRGSLATANIDDNLLDLEDDRLGDCTFARAELADVFRAFTEHFYDHLPIIESPVNPIALRQASPFLFWTIVVIVLQRVKAQSTERISIIVDAYRPLLGKTILATPHTLSTIQGLLYLANWPLAVEYQARDQSWTLIGIALNAAVYSGLHRPTQAQSLRSVGVFVDGRTRSSLWLACFGICTNLSQSIGVPPSLRSPEDLANISRLSSDASVSQHLGALAEIQSCAAKYTIPIAESTNLNLAALLERNAQQELDRVKVRFESCWNKNLEAVFLDSKLHIIATLAVSHGRPMDVSYTEPSKPPLDPSLVATLSGGSAFATRLIQMICLGNEQLQLSSNSITSTELYMEGRPKMYFRALIFAALFLLRYSISDDLLSSTDCHVARSHAEIAGNYLRTHSKHATDEPGRAASVIETLSRFSLASPNAVAGPMLVKERLGASVFYDALSRAHELRSKPVWLSNDREQPQQSFEVGAISSTTNAPHPGLARLSEDMNNGAETGCDMSFTGLPDDWLEHLGMDVLNLAGDLFNGPAEFA